MGSKDVISKSLIRRIVKDMAIYLLGLPVTRLEDIPTERRRIETRHADIVMRAELQDGQQFILHLENAGNLIHESATGAGFSRGGEKDVKRN